MLIDLLNLLQTHYRTDIYFLFSIIQHFFVFMVYYERQQFSLVLFSYKIFKNKIVEMYGQYIFSLVGG